MKLSLISFFLISTFSSSLIGQWDFYEAVWKGKPGKMIVHMDWMKSLPEEDLMYAIELDQKAGLCLSGIPEPSELDRIDLITAQVDSLLSQITYTEDVGRFIYECSLKDYYYVQDTSGITSLLNVQFAAAITFKIIYDPEWKVYSDFIYPDPFLEQTMANGKIIKMMESEGIDLEIKKILTHYASFVNKDDRNKYATFLKEQNFKILELDHQANAPFPYKIAFSRSDKPKIQQLSNITLRLHQKTEFLNGIYEGWQVALE